MEPTSTEINSADSDRTERNGSRSATWRFPLIISLALNGTLAAVLFLGLMNQPSRDAETGLNRNGEQDQQQVHSTRFTNSDRPLAGADGPLTLDSSNAPVAVARDQAPSWTDTEDTDLEVFIANLRALECPPETVRDILESVVFHQISERRREVMGPLQRRFWEFAVADDEFLDSFTKPIDILRKERNVLMNQIREYLGEESNTGLTDRERFEDEFSYLNPESRERLYSERSEVEQLREELLRMEVEGFGGGMGMGIGERDDVTMEEYADRKKDLEDRLSRALRACMTPEEYEEYRLRVTGAATWASDLVGFEPTPAELRAVARLQLQHDDQMNSIARMDTAARAREEERLNERLRDQTESILGSARYEEMTRSQSNGYRDLHRLAERFGLSPNQSSAAFEAHGAAVEEARRVSESFSGEARDELLTRIRTATEHELRSNLGEEAYEAYLRHGGEWIDELMVIEGRR